MTKASKSKSVAIVLFLCCLLFSITICGCSKADESISSSEEPFSAVASDVPEDIAVLEDVLEKYFDAAVTGNYEKLISILPPDIVCDDLFDGHISADEYTPELHKAIFDEYKEEFIAARDEYASWYGENLQVDYTILKREMMTQAGIEHLARTTESDAIPEILWDYADEYYSPIFDMKEVQGIELVSGEVRLSGDSEEYGYSQREYTACFIKHSSTWYFVGINCDLGNGLMWF